MGKLLKIAILISGRGSNMIALADYAEQDDVPCEIVAVIADQDASGLDAASKRSIPSFTVPSAAYSDKATHEDAIIQIINEHKADFIFLAGYMRMLSSDFCTRYEHRLFNIHPSLLPRHKGLNTHERAIHAGDKTHGCSVQLVDPEMDEGLVLAQCEVPVFEDDTPETLGTRVLAQEHQLYPALLGALVSGLLTIKNGHPEMNIGMLPGLIAGQTRQWPI